MKKNFQYLHNLRLFYFLSLLFFMVDCKPDAERLTGPVEPENALSTFELEPGFKIELLAAEPLVEDPVDMEIDEYGRLYVVEMYGYPLDKSGTGKIKLLSDTDGDGRMDKSTVFADGLTLPFGIMRWKKGLLVADAPHLLYLEDTTMDGRADIKEIMLTGFAFSNAQMNVGNPVYGLDNWIYLTSEAGGTYQVYKKDFGDLGSDIHFPGVPDAPRLPQAGSGRTVRFLPDQHKLELTSGTTQFGHDFDVWGHHLLGNNSDHIYHEVIAAPYLGRNPDLLVSDATQSLSDHGSEVFAITKNPERQLLTNVGIFTSACGNTLYTGGAFPAPYNDRAHFVAEPVSNIVHADLLNDEGASFSASRIGNNPKKEFLASTDAWFRPVNMYVGPDGALYLLDYYRQIIEHPEWMSEEAVKAGDLYNGMDMGRIYRITPTDAKAAQWTKGLKLGDASNEELVAELENPNRWWRQNAQRLLIDRNSEETVPAAEAIVRNSTSPMGRLHALWTLEGIGKLKPEIILLALKDTEAGIRENAIKLAELHLSSFPELEKALFQLQADADAKVRFQLLCTLGFIDTPQSAQVRNILLFKDFNDKWIQIAALSASSSESTTLLKVLMDEYKVDVPAYPSMIQRLTAMVAAAEDPAVIRQLIQKSLKTRVAKEPGWQAAVLEGLAQGIGSRELPPADFSNEQKLLINSFFEHPSSVMRQACLRLLKVTGIGNREYFDQAIEKAVAIAKNVLLSEEKRTEAINFLSLGDPASHETLLMQLIKPQEKPSIQLAALNTLSLIPGKTATDYVIEHWENLTPEIRNSSINTFLTSDERVGSLLDAIDAGKIQKASVSFGQSVELMTQSDEGLRKRARSMFAHNDEEKINKSYQHALTLKGDPDKGKAIYSQSCSMCHQVRESIGLSFGPDLGTIHNWKAEGIMANILAPNLSIAAGYELWAVETRRGESLQGIISSETPVAISLKIAGNAEKTINRTDIKSLKTLSISAMPAGLEKSINQQQMADLIAFLRQNK